MPGAVCSGDDGRCQRKSGVLVRESFPLVPEPLWGLSGGCAEGSEVSLPHPF